MKTIEEFKKAMMDETVQQEFKAFMEEKKPETQEAFAKAMMEFVASRDVEPTDGKKELSLDELEDVSGGKELRTADFENIPGSFFEVENVKKLFGFCAPALRPFLVALWDGIEDKKEREAVEITVDPIAENFANC